MTKDELIKLGLTDELADKVLEQHTAELTAEQQKTAEANTQLETAKKSVTELTEKVKAFDGVDLDGLKKSAADWESKYNADIAALKMDKALELALIGAKARDVDIVKSQIDVNMLKLDDSGKLVGLDEQLGRIKNDKAFLFDDASGDGGAYIDTAIKHGEDTKSISIDQARAVMGLSAKNGGK